MWLQGAQLKNREVLYQLFLNRKKKAQDHILQWKDYV